MPEFTVTRPSDKYQWGTKFGIGDVDMDNQVKRVARLEQEGILPTDLVAARLHARILPLQRREHRLCDISGPRYPTRICTSRIKTEDVCRRLQDITNSRWPEPFPLGCIYLTRQEKPRVVRTDCIPDFLLTRLLFDKLLLRSTLFSTISWRTARRSANLLLTARPTTPPTLSSMAALHMPSPPTRRNLLVIT